MSATDLLQANCERLLAQYNSNIQAIAALQTILIRDILPSVADELELSPEATEWAKEWLEDRQTRHLYHSAQRNNFTISFAMESVRKNLVWRLKNLWPLIHLAPTPLSMIHCLPKSARDPFGRPILLVKAIPLKTTSKNVKSNVIELFEGLRCHLKDINADSTTLPIFQYMIILDIKETSLRTFDLDLFTWTLREIIPRFPGMLGGVFILNYSWVHAGMWRIIKRLLPETALSRVFFLSNEEILQYFTPASLPQDYGGTMSTLDFLDDPLWMQDTASRSEIVTRGEISTPDPPFGKYSLSPTSISPTSLLNPFFGYPAFLAYGSLSLKHGRRRKRDLARTLLLLFWIRWRKVLIVGTLLALSVAILKMGAQGVQARSLRSFLARNSLLKMGASAVETSFPFLRLPCAVRHCLEFRY
ncbi:hypothetical protein J132_06268 [Termitomyces sp. J132]|nr:hypothetical protein J132_06268 [Termitomyces sp. J132]